MVVADHVQGVVRTNFHASWDEIGEDHEMEDTFALSSMQSLEGTYDCILLLYFVFPKTVRKGIKLHFRIGTFC